MHIKEGAWVVVCDGAKAIVLENIGDPTYPDLRMREAQEQPDRRTREIGTDAPGRAINSVGSIRSAVEQTDFHDESERTFLTISPAASTRRSPRGKPALWSSSRRHAP